MKAIAVDDEIYMLETLVEAVSASPDIEQTEGFSSCSAALAYAADNPVDVAFLDIQMRGMGGLSLAEKLLALQPNCKIIFCTGYENYAVDAFRLHVSGYLLKPITAEAVQRELDHIKGLQTAEKPLTVKCFGNFEVFHHKKVLHFRRKKTKELLAVLIDRNGAAVTAKELCVFLFPSDDDDSKNMAYLRQLILDLKTALREIGAEDVLCHETPYYRIDTARVNCDFFSYLERGEPRFRGEYMTQYSWAETTCGMLQFEA